MRKGWVLLFWCSGVSALGQGLPSPGSSSRLQHHPLLEHPIHSSLGRVVRRVMNRTHGKDSRVSNSSFTVTVRREHCESRCQNHKTSRAEYRIFISHVCSVVHLFNKHPLSLRVLRFIEGTDTSRMPYLAAVAQSLIDRCTQNPSAERMPRVHRGTMKVSKGSSKRCV